MKQIFIITIIITVILQTCSYIAKEINVNHLTKFECYDNAARLDKYVKMLKKK